MGFSLRVVTCAVVCIGLAACGKGEDNKAPAKSSPVARAKVPKVTIQESGDQSRDSCAPLSVTLDGKPLALKHGRAKLVHGTPTVVLYESEVDCDTFMNDEISTYDVVHVAVGIGRMNKGRVSVGSSRGGTAWVNRVDMPAGPGGTMALCVPNAVQFEPLHAHMKGPLRVQGLVEGKYCGAIAKPQ